MNRANNTRLILTKAALWFLVGCAGAVALVRYFRGLGATTALSDVNPWGLWIGFDVLSGVALAAGGFVIAATVYIFHLDRYRVLVRPAVLTAFLGYLAVALGLMVDLGRPWNIWRPVFFWQLDSPLFEVAWCVILYLGVLALEFLPVVFEGFRMSAALRFMRRLTLLLVIAGIGLSSLHQSSLGTLFLLARDRIHPLWYSPILPLLFFVSAVALGLAMVIFESSVSSWLYRREGEWGVLRGLTRAASVTLALYLALRLGDLIWRGQLHHVLAAKWASLLFVIELAMSVVLPMVLFTFPATRARPWAVVTGSASSVAGFILHRADVGGIAHIPVTGQPYLPAITELIISLGLLSAMALIFLFCVERLPVWDEPPPVPEHFTAPVTDPVSRAYFGGSWFSRSHLAAAALAAGAVVGVIVIELTVADRDTPWPIPVRQSRSVAAERIGGSEGAETQIRLVSDPGPVNEGMLTVLLIDGDRAGRQTLFDHRAHQNRLGGESSCGACHHRTFRLDRGTACGACHRDMYSPTDTFVHERHVELLGQNLSCERCHPDPAVPKVRTAATGCQECHAQDTSKIFAVEPEGALPPGIAPGYRDAMHRLCITCHQRNEAERRVAEPYLSRCANCHRGDLSGEGVGGSAVLVASLGGT